MSQNPVFQRILQRYPDVFQTPVDELERELDRKFNKIIQTKGSTCSRARVGNSTVRVGLIQLVGRMCIPRNGSIPRDMEEGEGDGKDVMVG